MTDLSEDGAGRGSIGAQAPLVPLEVDLTDFQYMQLDVRRLRDSKVASLVSGEEFRCAVLLWCAAWHQIPSGSLPDDDVELAQLAGFGRAVGEWQQHRRGALYGFILCSDGRLYHPVIAEKACDGWNEKLIHRHKRECDRIRKTNKFRKEDGKPDLPFPPEPALISVGKAVQFQRNSGGARQETPTPSAGNHINGHGIPLENALKGKGEVREREGRGRDKGEGLKNPKVKTLAPGSEKTGPPAPAKSAAVWDSYATAYSQRYRVEPVRNASVNSKLAAFVDRIGATEAPAVAAFFVRHNGHTYVRSKHAVGLLLQDAEGLRTEWASGRTVTETEARQADQTQARGNVFNSLLEEARATATE